MEEIQRQMVEANKYERTNALKEVKIRCAKLVFTTGLLNDLLAESRIAKGK